ncbi:hypothetical protein [Flavobacterium sp. 3HN19-14]|uniref:hypothetical protein n=1 Tax=Flavobacterium sp. 3HN19-14 TaxID=3448133 RepID=UPI003EE0EC95
MLDNYVGTFSSKLLPIKLEFSDVDGILNLQVTGYPLIPLEDMGNDKFEFKQAGLTAQYNADKSQVTFHAQGQDFVFTKDKK